ncbi:MAG TPA: FadR/GntR family transcriptional regulator [Burkholderiales bacterium]|nr:FadR/GntR family transcriptional regulator [Burkholderiales bacterium]
MPLQAVEPLRLYRQIAGQIAALIEQGEYQAGAKLPAERELASLLGVSRTSVREAIISLEISGLVEVRVGTGIFVRQPTRATKMSQPITASNDAGPGPFELLSARALIEGEIAALAAKHRRKSDVTALRDTITRMRKADENFVDRDAADREFHERIASMTGNGALTWVVSSLWEQRRGDLWQRTEAHFHTSELREKTLLDHEAIVDAIDAEDPEGARAAMRRHLSRVAHEFQRRIDAASAQGKPSRARRAASKQTRSRRIDIKS